MRKSSFINIWGPTVYNWKVALEDLKNNSMTNDQKNSEAREKG